MTIKVKPQGPRFKKFEIWTKMAKVPKPQGPKWQFTLLRKMPGKSLCFGEISPIGYSLHFFFKLQL
ncbi:hypothetical protein HanXRQr2_Chr04g0172901 [Helianthus annuus]|uniref:Uncharacterized protein n=1 Tax=Helianthus annuus TaxID=4232 RepID=A0A9K3JAB9_HELAN|nr:hypothetical protein HanXRQr2_Chr04g0172901 [Helianthus annuus]KAJ0931838.1 hypothetical protein HanPSC8_Chr04g0166601 [Helianthus annuus]